MPFYSVSYNSMTATYGPSVIEADSEIQARLRFKGTAFSSNELPLISAREISAREIQQALSRKKEEDRE